MKFTATHITILVCVITVCTTSLLLTGRLVISAHVAESFLVAVTGFVSYVVGLLQRQPVWVERAIRPRSGPTITYAPSDEEQKP